MLISSAFTTNQTKMRFSRMKLAAILTTLVFLFSVPRVLLEVHAQQNGNEEANTKPVQVVGLRDKVTIRRDERGIPYIEAKNDEDLYFAQGYITASDRLWQMDLFRRTARGELAEVLGAGPNNVALEQDKQHRLIGFAHEADAEAAQTSPQSRTLLEAYAKGVNAYSVSLDAKSLPPEFQIIQYKPRPWTPSDSLIIVKIFFEALSNTWRLDLMREALAVVPAEKRAALLPEISPIDVLVVGKDTTPAKSSSVNSSVPTSFSRETLLALARNESVSTAALARIGFYSESLAASNNWVVSGKHTVSGKTLLANDPHLAPTAPSIWYMVQLNAPGLRVAGVTAPGLPGIIIGHNDHIAWGFTNVGPDVQDLYLEKFDSNNAKRYLAPSGWLDADIRHEDIKVRKSFADSTTDTVSLDVTVTRHGPIVFEK